MTVAVFNAETENLNQSSGCSVANCQESDD